VKKKSWITKLRKRFRIKAERFSIRKMSSSEKGRFYKLKQVWHCFALLLKRCRGSGKETTKCEKVEKSARGGREEALCIQVKKGGILAVKFQNLGGGDSQSWYVHRYSDVETKKR